MSTQHETLIRLIIQVREDHAPHVFNAVKELILHHGLNSTNQEIFSAMISADEQTMNPRVLQKINALDRARADYDERVAHIEHEYG